MIERLVNRHFRIINETRGKTPRFSYEEVKNAILGKHYDLTMIITDPARMKKLNTIYRDKESATDILSFPISKNEGEIYICPSETKKEAKKFERTYENFFAYLFIHGCTHLKGHDHGAIMESIEARIRRKFGV
jgi:probable rRNA maturation factor